jgi:hypothetical protein
MVAALQSCTHPTWLRCWGSGSLVESKWCDYVVVEVNSHLKLLPTSILNIYKVFEHINMLSIGTQCQLYTVLPTPLGSYLGFCANCRVKMMWLLCHGWGWQPPQTASCIHSEHKEIVWVHWYAVHWHTVTALQSYTHLTFLRFWGLGSLVESKWCDHYVMVEADGYLKLLPSSIVDMYKMFEHIDMLSMDIH